MKMKTVLFLLIGAFLFATPSYAITSAVGTTSATTIAQQNANLKKEFKMQKKVEKIKKFLQKGGSDKLSKGLYVLLAIIGWGFLAMGLVSDWEGSDWIICLILSFLFILPGLIYALIKMKNYY
jgi:hypothetical protein